MSIDYWIKKAKKIPDADFIWNNRTWDKFIVAEFAELEPAEWVFIASFRYRDPGKWYGY
jgi:hypothetical protein